MSIILKSSELKKNIPHVYDDLYKRHREKTFDVEITKVSAIAFEVRQLPYNLITTYKNEFPSKSPRLLGKDVDYINSKYR